MSPRLRLAGRPRSQLQEGRRRLVHVEAWIGRCSFCQHVLVGHCPFGHVAAYGDEAFDRRQGTACSVDGGGKPAVEDQRLGSDFRQRRHMCLHVEMAVQHHTHHVETFEREPRLDHLRAIERQHRDALALRDSQRGEPGADAVSALAQFGVGQPAAAVPHRNAIRKPHRRLRKRGSCFQNHFTTSCLSGGNVASCRSTVFVTSAPSLD